METDSVTSAKHYVSELIYNKMWFHARAKLEDITQVLVPIVRVDNITRSYLVGSQEICALRGVDLTVHTGRFAALSGRSGSGKTTLLNCIGCLDRPTTGEIWLEGKNLARISEQKRVKLRREQIGFVFQSHALLPNYSAAENIDLKLRLAGLSRVERQRRVKDVLQMVGLLKWADHRPYELSGGQQQRLAIARALSARPALVLADEPTGELDTNTGQQILELFRWVVDYEQATILIATHDLTVDLYADDVYRLRDGKIVC